MIQQKLADEISLNFPELKICKNQVLKQGVTMLFSEF